MTFDPSRPVQTRDGRKATILATDLMGPYPIAARWRSEFSSRSNEDFVGRFHATGCLHVPELGECVGDLINIPETHELTVYFYRSPVGELYAGQAPYSQGNPLASKRITFTVGEFEEEQGT